MTISGSRINGRGPLLGSFDDLLGPNLEKYHAHADFGTNMIYHGGSRVLAIKHEIL